MPLLPIFGLTCLAYALIGIHRTLREITTYYKVYINEIDQIESPSTVASAKVEQQTTNNEQRTNN